MSGLEIFLAKKIGTIVAKKFGGKVIERWTRYRANRFFDGFVASLADELETGIESDDVDAALEKILGDEQKSEVLFDAYRSVCFAKSKSLGPRIIGLLTGYLVVEGATSKADDDAVFRAAEELNDIDLTDFSDEFQREASKADSCKNKEKDAHWVGDTIQIPWTEETRDSAWPHSRESEIDLSPLNFDEVFGSWGGNVARLGLLTSKVTHRSVDYREDSERYIDEDGALDIYAWTVTFESPCRLLSDLVQRALKMEEQETIT